MFRRLIVGAALLAAFPAFAGPVPAGAPAAEVTVMPTFAQLAPGSVPRPAIPGRGGAAGPLDRSGGHAMWDPLGGGCVDGGGADDPFPAGKGDMRAPPFCLPQPCARSLTRDELARDVVGRPLRPGEWDRYVSRYAEACRLGTQLARLCERVERERILVLLLDDLRRDPRSEWCRVQAFLGLRDDGRMRFPVINAAKERRSLLLKQAEDAYLHLRTRAALPPLDTGLFARLDRWNRRPRTRTPLSAEMRRELREVFAPEVDLLERLTGRDLSCWKDQEAPA